MICMSIYPPWITPKVVLFCFVVFFIYICIYFFWIFVQHDYSPQPTSGFMACLAFELTSSLTQNRAPHSSIYKAKIIVVPVNSTSPMTLHFPKEPTEAVAVKPNKCPLTLL